MKKLVALIILVVGLGYLALTNPGTEKAAEYYAETYAAETGALGKIGEALSGLIGVNEIYRENYVFFSLYEVGDETHLIGFAGDHFAEVSEDIWDSTESVRNIVQKQVAKAEQE